MRIQINLATRPYVELRPFFARLRIVMAALAVIAIALAVLLQVEHKKLVAADKQMDALRQRTIAAQREKLGNESRMQQPVNATVLNRARFLNNLFLRKSFSWTAVMMDLEMVLPTGVQVAAIEPSVTTDGSVVIRLRVSGDRDRAIQLVRNLERSARFRGPRLVGETAMSKEQAAVAAQAGLGGGGVDFDILADYNPLPEGDVLPVLEKPADSPAKLQRDPAASRSARKTTMPRPAVKAGPNDGVVLKPYVGPANPAAKGGTR